MIINWIEVRDPDPDQEEPYTEYFVGATTEERVRYAGFLDVNETNPSSVSLKVYSNGHWADSLTGLAQLLQQLKTAGYAVTWHKILPNTILGGTHTELTKDCTAYINSFTVTQEEEGFTVRILGQITEEQKVSTGEEVLRLLGTSLRREPPAS